MLWLKFKIALRFKREPKRRKRRIRKKMINRTNSKCSKSQTLQISKSQLKQEQKLFIVTKMEQSGINPRNNKNKRENKKFWPDWHNGRKVWKKAMNNLMKTNTSMKILDLPKITKYGTIQCVDGNRKTLWNY